MRPMRRPLLGSRCLLRREEVSALDYLAIYLDDSFGHA
jgi:hypothetical protein